MVACTCEFWVDSENVELNTCVEEPPVVPVTTDFVLTMRTTTPDEGVRLELNGTNDVEIDWGDGTIESSTASRPFHRYVNAGDYIISMSGSATKLAFGNTADAAKVISVSNLGVLGWESMSYALHNCFNMESFTAGNTDTSSVVFFTNMLNGCTSLVDAPDLVGLDTSSATALPSMLGGLSSMLNAPDVSSFDTSLVANIDHMLEGWTSAGEVDLGIDTWDITSLGLVNSFFLNDTTLTTACYDRTLIAWSQQSVPSNLSISFGFSKYTAGGAAEAARNILTSTYGWTITDGGPA